MRAWAMLAAVAAVALAGCQGEAGKAPADRPEPEAIRAEAPPPLTQADAFRLAFGAASPFRRMTTDPEVGPQEMTYTPAALIELGEIRVLVSKGQNAADCHLCTGALAVHYLKPDAGAWKVVAGSMEMLPGSGFGMPPEIAVRRDLGPAPVLVAEAGWTGQGYTCTTVDLVELGPEAPVVLVEDLLIHTDNRGVVGDEGPVEETNATIAGSAAGEIVVTHKGHRNGRLTYARRGPKLMPASGDTGLNEC